LLNQPHRSGTRPRRQRLRSLDAWWLADRERAWFQTRIFQIASVLLADALDGVAYHLVGFEAPRPPKGPDECATEEEDPPERADGLKDDLQGQDGTATEVDEEVRRCRAATHDAAVDWWRTLSHFGQLVPTARRTWPTADDGNLVSMSSLRAWLHRTVESWPLSGTGGTIGSICRGLGIHLWFNSAGRAQRDLAVLDGRTSDILDGLADLDTICAVAEATADRPFPFTAVSLLAAVTSLRWNCWRAEWELRVVTSREERGHWLPGTRTPRRGRGRPTLLIWPLLDELERWLRCRHQNWRRALDQRMPWTFVAHELAGLGCTNVDVDDARAIARLARALREGLRRWHGGHAISGTIVNIA
jgi:hypothetical protein